MSNSEIGTNKAVSALARISEVLKLGQPNAMEFGKAVHKAFSEMPEFASKDGEPYYPDAPKATYRKLHEERQREILAAHMGAKKQLDEYIGARTGRFDGTCTNESAAPKEPIDWMHMDISELYKRLGRPRGKSHIEQALLYAYAVPGQEKDRSQRCPVKVWIDEASGVHDETILTIKTGDAALLWHSEKIVEDIREMLGSATITLKPCTVDPNWWMKKRDGDKCLPTLRALRAHTEALKSEVLRDQHRQDQSLAIAKANGHVVAFSLGGTERRDGRFEPWRK